LAIIYYFEISWLNDEQPTSPYDVHIIATKQNRQNKKIKITALSWKSQWKAPQNLAEAFSF